MVVVRPGESRVKIFYFTIPYLVSILSSGAYEVVDGFPPDAKPVRFGYTPEADSIFIVIESSEFPPVAEGGCIPSEFVAVKELVEKVATYEISPANLITTAVACLQFGEECE